MAVLYIYRSPLEEFLLQMYNVMPHASATSVVVRFPASVKDIPVFRNVYTGNRSNTASHLINNSDKCKSKVHLEQTTKVQKGSTGIALFFL